MPGNSIKNQRQRQHRHSGNSQQHRFSAFENGRLQTGSGELQQMSGNSIKNQRQRQHRHSGNSQQHRFSAFENGRLQIGHRFLLSIFSHLQIFGYQEPRVLTNGQQSEECRRNAK